MSGKTHIFVNYMAQFRANTTERYQRVQPSNKHICFITILKLYTVYIFFYKIYHLGSNDWHSIA